MLFSGRPVPEGRAREASWRGAVSIGSWRGREAPARSGRQAREERPRGRETRVDAALGPAVAEPGPGFFARRRSLREGVEGPGAAASSVRLAFGQPGCAKARPGARADSSPPSSAAARGQEPRASRRGAGVEPPRAVPSLPSSCVSAGGAPNRPRAPLDPSSRATTPHAPRAGRLRARRRVDARLPSPLRGGVGGGVAGPDSASAGRAPPRTARRSHTRREIRCGGVRRLRSEEGRAGRQTASPASSNRTASPAPGSTSAPSHIARRPRTIVPIGQPVTAVPS